MYQNDDDDYNLRNNLGLLFEGVSKSDIDKYDQAVINDLIPSSSDSSAANELPALNCSSSGGSNVTEELPFDTFNKITYELNEAAKVLLNIAIIYRSLTF